MILTDERWYSMIADAIRLANGESTSYTPQQMAEMLPGMLAATSDYAIADAIATATGPINLMGPRASFIAPYAFRSMSTPIGIANFPRATWVGSSAFFACAGLQSIRLSQCSHVGYGAFQSCTSLVNAYLPNCVDLSVSAFMYCYSLASVTLTALEAMDGRALMYCSALTQISLPKCTSIGEYALYNCASLWQAILPKCQTIGPSAFCYCASLSRVVLTECQTIGASAFYNCSSIGELSLPSLRSIGSSAFYGCYRLSVLNLVGVPSVPTISGSVSGCFYNTPMCGYSSYYRVASIFVDEALYGSFMTQWSAVSSKIVSVQRGS